MKTMLRLNGHLHGLNWPCWKTRWINGDYVPRKNIRYPADCFKKDFPIAKAVKKARLYITACGLYEARVKGRRVGQFCLAPGCTDYRKRLQYQTFDVTELLLNEKNTQAAAPIPLPVMVALHGAMTANPFCRFKGGRNIRCGQGSRLFGKSKTGARNNKAHSIEQCGTEKTQSFSAKLINTPAAYGCWISDRT
jgi:hypothetical protein